MFHFRHDNCRLVILAKFFVFLPLAFASCPAQARQVLLFPNQSNNAVGEYSAVTGASIDPIFVSQGLSFPFALGLDGTNGLLVANTAFGSGQGTIGLYSVNNGAPINTAFMSVNQLQFPDKLVADRNNHVFVANSHNNSVAEYNATTGAIINANFVSGQGLASPGALAVDNKNHLYVANSAGESVGEYDATTGATINAAFISLPLFSTPYALAVDGNNHLFVANSGSGEINDNVGEYDATTGMALNSILIDQGLSTPIGLALDDNKHLFVLNQGNSTVGEYDATTGAAVNASFISGLVNPLDMVFVSSVPEPSSLAMIGAAGIGLTRIGRRRPALMQTCPEG